MSLIIMQNVCLCVFTSMVNVISTVLVIKAIYDCQY